MSETAIKCDYEDCSWVSVRAVVEIAIRHLEIHITANHTVRCKDCQDPVTYNESATAFHEIEKLAVEPDQASHVENKVGKKEKAECQVIQYQPSTAMHQACEVNCDGDKINYNISSPKSHELLSQDFVSNNVTKARSLYENAGLYSYISENEFRINVEQKEACTTKTENIEKSRAACPCQKSFKRGNTNKKYKKTGSPPLIKATMTCSMQ